MMVLADTFYFEVVDNPVAEHPVQVPDQAIVYDDVRSLIPQSNKYVVYQIFGKLFVAYTPKGSMVKCLPILVKALCKGMLISLAYLIP